jgi:hypothetical protein
LFFEVFTVTSQLDFKASSLGWVLGGRKMLPGESAQQAKGDFQDDQDSQDNESLTITSDPGERNACKNGCNQQQDKHSDAGADQIEGVFPAVDFDFHPGQAESHPGNGQDAEGTPVAQPECAMKACEYCANQKRDDNAHGETGEAVGWKCFGVHVSLLIFENLSQNRVESRQDELGSNDSEQGGKC